jgi:hypothetical protein
MCVVLKLPLGCVVSQNSMFYVTAEPPLNCHFQGFRVNNVCFKDSPFKIFSHFQCPNSLYPYHTLTGGLVYIRALSVCGQ